MSALVRNTALLIPEAGRVRVAGHDPVRQAAAVRVDVLAHLPGMARVPTRRSGR
jgi:ABC-type uncharacterized transport system ATPase subunit